MPLVLRALAAHAQPTEWGSYPFGSGVNSSFKPEDALPVVLHADHHPAFGVGFVQQ
jgi:hypothetical protein